MCQNYESSVSYGIIRDIKLGTKYFLPLTITVYHFRGKEAMRFLIFIYGEKYGRRFLLSKDANQKCRILLTKDEFFIEQTMFLELEYIMQEWYVKETAYYKVSKKQFFQTERVEENQAVFIS